MPEGVKILKLQLLINAAGWKVNAKLEYKYFVSKRIV
jgi:hypothetical protein